MQYIRSVLRGVYNCSNCSVNQVTVSYHVTIRPHLKWVRRERKNQCVNVHSACTAGIKECLLLLSCKWVG